MSATRTNLPVAKLNLSDKPFGKERRVNPVSTVFVESPYVVVMAIFSEERRRSKNGISRLL